MDDYGYVITRRYIGPGGAYEQVSTESTPELAHEVLDALHRSDDWHLVDVRASDMRHLLCATCLGCLREWCEVHASCQARIKGLHVS